MSKHQTAKQEVLYKGVMVPAMSLKIGKGKTKLIPTHQDKYMVHGIPYPRNLRITREILLIAEEIVAASKNNPDNEQLILAEYVRKGRDGYILQNRTLTTEDESVTEYFIGRGEPYGVIVAFLYKNELRIGWSKRLEGEKSIHGKTVPREPLGFTKKDAVNIAVMRGLVDSIDFRGSDAYTGEEKKVIPKSIAKILWPFIKRTQRYFKREAVNVKTEQ